MILTKQHLHIKSEHQRQLQHQHKSVLRLTVRPRSRQADFPIQADDPKPLKTLAGAEKDS